MHMMMYSLVFLAQPLLDCVRMQIMMYNSVIF